MSLFPERELATIDEVAAQAGTDPDLVRRVWRAAGFADPEPGQPAMFVRGTELFAGLSASIEFFGEEATMQIVRLLGAAAARIADAAISIFVVNAVPNLESNTSLIELAQANVDGVALIPALVSGFDVLLRHHMHAGRRFNDIVVEGVELQHRSVGFVDLVGSTGLATALTPRAFAAAFTEFDAMSTDIIVAHGGRMVKLIGDEVMFSATDERVAVEIALALIDAFVDHDVLPPVRAGVASGEVLLRDGDYSGSVVNLAARAVKIARPSTLLVDGATRDALDADGYSCRSIGSLSLKGFDERVKLYRVRRAG